MTWLSVILIPPIGHAAWSHARSTGEVGGASPVAIALAAVLLETSIFVGLLLAVLSAARLNGTHLPLVLLARLVLSVRAAVRIARLNLPVAVVVVLLGSAAGVLFGFAAASLIYA